MSNESIFHHTYQHFLSGHILEYTNSFAHWVAESLGEKALSEYLSNIDPYDRALIRLRKGHPALANPVKEQMEIRALEGEKALFVRRWSAGKTCFACTISAEPA